MSLWIELKKKLFPLDIIKKDAAREESKFERYWQEYLRSLPRKSLLIHNLSEGPGFKQQVQDLKQHLAFELDDIAREEKSDEELIADLKRITNQNEEAVNPLEKAEKRLQKLFDLLTNQLCTLANLSQKDPDLPRNHLIRHLQETSTAEQELIDHIQELEKEQGQKIHKIIE